MTKTKKTLAIILTMIVIIICTIFVLYSTDITDKPKIANNKIQKNETPAETIEKFTKLMFAGTGKGGNTKSLAKALNFIEHDTSKKKPTQNNLLLKQANELFLLLQSVNYTLDEIDIIKKEGKTEIIELGDSNSSIQLSFFYTDKFGWIFSKENFSTKGFDSAMKHLENIKANLNEHADDFIPDLSSPLNTAYTFTFGIQERFGFTIEDAVKALDLSHFDPVVIQELGATWAIQTYRILLYASPIKPESLSNNPLYEGNVILLLDPDFGMLGMNVVTDPITNKKAWKIQYSGINSISGTYDSYMKMGMTKEINEYNIKSRPLHVIMDDFFQIHMPYLEKMFLGFNLWKFPATILLLLSSFIVAPLIKIIVLPILNLALKELSITSEKDKNKRFILPLQISIIAFIWLEGFVEITANPYIISYTVIALNIVLCFAIGLLICRIIDAVTNIASNKFDTALHIITSVIGKLLKLAIIISAALYICGILGIDTKNFLAALGIGGFAVALAGKDTMENFFGSIMIIIDRQFNNGDVIKINNIEGTIEQVSVRSTRIRTFDNSIVTVPNRMFISSSVENTSMRQWRRYKTSLDIVYNTDISVIKEFTQGISKLAYLHPSTRKDNIQVFFNEFATSSLQIYISIFFKNKGKLAELKAREEINSQIMLLAKKIGVKFAYPTQTLHLTNEDKDEKEELQISNSTQDTSTTNISGVDVAKEISPYYNESESKK